MRQHEHVPIRTSICTYVLRRRKSITFEPDVDVLRRRADDFCEAVRTTPTLFLFPLQALDYAPFIVMESWPMAASWIQWAQGDDTIVYGEHNSDINQESETRPS